MAREKRYTSAALLARRSSAPRRRPPGQARPTALDWPAWLALIERKRRILQRHLSLGQAGIPDSYFVIATLNSFHLEGIDVTEQEIIHALTPGAAQRKFRSRAGQRIRNHVAILHSIESALRLGQPLKASIILRWYTSVSSGLSTNELGADRMMRLDQIARRINSPQLRIQPAIIEIARTHLSLLSDPLFPGFNGILARLLLRYHLGRCGLPFAIFDPNRPPMDSSNELRSLMNLLTAIDEAYDLLLG